MYKDIISAFEKKNIHAISVKNKKEACELILKMIPKNSTIGYGGSLTLESIGILDLLRNAEYQLYDRSKVPKYTKESNELGHKAQHANFFLAGSNAITKDGYIVNTDRTGNRVSSLMYGPEKVIIVVGKNKIVDNVDKAFERIKNIAAPLNAKKMNLNTPCVKTGKCMNCDSPESICCYTAIIRRQFKKDRMTLIIVEEDLGY